MPKVTVILKNGEVRADYRGMTYLQLKTDDFIRFEVGPDEFDYIPRCEIREIRVRISDE